MTIDFTTFLLSVGAAGYHGLGFREGRMEPDLRETNLDLARQNIDLLELLSVKTKGNRTADEDRLMEQLLFETRMAFVGVQKKMEEQAASAKSE